MTVQLMVTLLGTALMQVYRMIIKEHRTEKSAVAMETKSPIVPRRIQVSDDRLCLLNLRENRAMIDTDNYQSLKQQTMRCSPG